MSCKYLQLNDEVWLREIYLNQRWSTMRISKLLGCKTPNSVRQALLRFGIVPRNFRQAQVDGCFEDKMYHPKTAEGLVINHSVIEGGLLGDAGLRRTRKESIVGGTMFYRRNKYLDHVQFVGNILYPDGNAPIKPEWHKHPRDKTKPSLLYHKLATMTDMRLNSYFERWYPEPLYKKVVPNDLILTSEMLLHWYLDDGCCYHRRKESPIKQLTISLSCQCFSREDQERLRDEIYRLGVDSTVSRTNSGSGWFIKIKQAQAQDFLSLIGPPPVESLKYKWK